jgi:hypothetical protein
MEQRAPSGQLLTFMSERSGGSLWRKAQWNLVLGLAAAAMLFQVLDGATAIQMMYESGQHAELNPVIRDVFHNLGPLGVLSLKVGVASVVLSMLVYLAHRGHVVLARNFLLISIGLGVIGTLSNIELG